MKGSTAIANVLKLEGVKFLTAFPGGGSTGPISRVINESPGMGIRTLLTRTERVAVNIADGYTRVSGRTGVAAISEGVGVENAFCGISQAFSDMVPMLVLGGQNARNRSGSRATQDLDAISSLYKRTKWAECINYADRVPEFMRRAFTYLRSGRPGPVYLELPRDVAGEEFDDAKFSYKPVKGWKTAGDPCDVEVAVRALLAAKTPLIYTGVGVLQADGCDELHEFAELVQAPVMTTMLAKGAFPENHPLSVGSGGREAGKTAAHFLRKADLVFSIGTSLTRGRSAHMAHGKIIVQSNVDELDINRDYQPDHIIIGDAKLVLKQLISEVKKQAASGRAENQALNEEIKRVKDEWLNEWMPKLTSDETPINPYRVIWDLMHTVNRENTIITHDSGWPRAQLFPFWETIIPRGYIGWGHHTTMGYSLGGAMGAKLAKPEKMVINIMGDGSFGMVGMDFETAVREKIPILTIILNNSSLGHYLMDTPSTAVLSGNYAKVAEGLGGYSERVEKPDEIIPAIKRATKSLESNLAALLEIMVKLESAVQNYWTDKSVIDTATLD